MPHHHIHWQTEDIETTENTTDAHYDPFLRPMRFSVVSRTFYLNLLCHCSQVLLTCHKSFQAPSLTFP